VFEFEALSVRFLKIDGVDCAVGVDVARVLGYANPNEAVRDRVDAEYKGVSKLLTPRGVQLVTVIFEPGIYQLIFSSKLPLAKEFQHWVFEKVLPSIRKTGNPRSRL
jgi:anti-repressor protein